MAELPELLCRECGRRYAAAPMHVCEYCFAPLDPVYDYEQISKGISRTSIAAGPLSVWRYADLLPAGDGPRVDLGAGLTPLLKADRLAAELGLQELYLKNDTANPTHSFKDRVVTVALTVARQMDFDTVACASTGNLANSVAAHAARAGLRSFVFIPADLEEGKVISTAVYGGNLVQVKGNYDEVNRLCSEIAGALPWAFVNVNLRAFYAEGSKTIAFELCEQMQWRAPDCVVVPVASGSLLTKIHKGLNELYLTGIAPEPHTKIHAAQAAGCAPVVTALLEGREHIRPVREPRTVAKSLAIGNPADGSYAVSTVRSTGGAAAQATDAEIIDGIKLLARTEGIFTETAGGVTVAALEKLVREGAIHPKETCVALITGMGLKTAEALAGHTGPTMLIRPSLDEFQSQLDVMESLS